MKKSKNKIAVFATFVALCVSPYLSAAIIDDGNHVLVNGERWLDLTETAGLSYSTIVNDYSN